MLLGLVIWMEIAVLSITSLFLNLVCNLVVPVVENIACRLRIGDCGCSVDPSPSTSPEIDVRHRRKKARHSGGNSNGDPHSELRGSGKDTKRVKLLVDITVRQVGGPEQEVVIKKKTKYVNETNKYQMKQEGLFAKIFNIPSSITLAITSQLRKWAHDMNHLETKSCDSDRIKKSPKRRISRGNYRKIIPFFPFNLLGFSNYSAFQMPALTHCQRSNEQEQTNNLNVSTVSGRCKRRRSSSTGESCSSISDDDFSHLEISEIPPTTETVPAGHDEVDSDESSDTVTKPIVSSSSSNDAQDDKTAIEGQAHSSKDANNQNGENENGDDDDDEFEMANGEPCDDVRVVKSFLEELDEIANEDYRSDEDPDYKPEESASSTTDSYNSDESFLDSSISEEGVNNGNTAGALETITSAVEASTMNGNRKSLPSIPVPPNNHNSKNGHHNNQNGGDGDDYKTPEEEEPRIHPFLGE